jgi:hypothetical protein
MAKFEEGGCQEHILPEQVGVLNENLHPYSTVQLTFRLGRQPYALAALYSPETLLFFYFWYSFPPETE